MPPVLSSIKIKKITIICSKIKQKLSSLNQTSVKLEHININHHHRCGDSNLQNNIIQLALTSSSLVISVLLLATEQIDSNVMRWRVLRVGTPSIKQTSQ